MSEPDSSRFRPDMTDDEILAELERIRAEPGMAEILAAAPRELTQEQAARIARLLFGA